MSVQDTALAGSPASITGAATYLRGTFGTAATAFADSIFAGRSTVLGAWQGETGDAFAARLRTVGERTDSLSAAATSIAGPVQTLADHLAAAQELLAQARDTATTGGLTVDGTIVHGPEGAPPPVGDLAADADAPERMAHQQAVAAIEAHDAKVKAWNEVVATGTQAFGDWNTALDDFAATWRAASGDIASLASSLLSGAAGATDLANQGYKLLAQRNLNQGWRDSAARSLEAAVGEDGQVTVGRGRFYEVVDQIAKNDAAIGAADDGLGALTVTSKLGRGLLVLGVAATGYGIYDDMQHGESAQQAVVSNVGGFAAGAGAGFVASLGAGALVGAVAGSAVPVVGTVVGAVVGGVVGGAVGSMTSGAIDHLYEDSSAGVSDTLEAGWDELAGTGAAIGNLATDAWDAIF